MLNRLTFEIDLDQTYLPPLIGDLEDLVAFLRESDLTIRASHDGPTALRPADQ